MAVPTTIKTIALDGATRDFEIPYEYLARKFIKVTLLGQNRLVLKINDDYRFTSRGIITTTRAWGPSDGYDSIELRRETSATDRLVEFADGSILNAHDLNTSQIQTLHIAEEGRDISTDTLGTDADGNLDARGRRITHVGDAVEDSDAVTLRQARALAATVNGIIGTNTTLLVPQQYPTIQAAFTYLSGYMIMPPVTVRILVADNHVNPPGVVANHPQGRNIQLIGNQTDPTKVVIRGPNDYNGDAVAVTNGCELGLIDGFLIDRPLKAEWPFNGSGLLVHARSWARTGPNMIIRGWFYGAAARNGSVLDCRGIKVFDAGDVGIWSYQQSHIQCDDATVDGVDAAGQPWGFGFQAEYGSVLAGARIIARRCKVGGVASLSRSITNCPTALTEFNTGSGFFCRDGSGIEAHGATSKNNGGYGSEILEGNGAITGTITYADNAKGNINAYAISGSLDGGARVSASTGDLRIDSRNRTYFNGTSGVQFEVRNSAAGGWTYAFGGPVPGVAAEGPLANMDYSVSSKGAGSIFLNTGGTPQVRVVHVPGATSRITLSGGKAGQPAVISTDTGVPLRLTSGTGRIQLGTFRENTSNWTIKGYVDVESESGQVLHLAVIG